MSKLSTIFALIQQDVQHVIGAALGFTAAIEAANAKEAADEERIAALEATVNGMTPAFGDLTARLAKLEALPSLADALAADEARIAALEAEKADEEAALGGDTTGATGSTATGGDATGGSGAAPQADGAPAADAGDPAATGDAVDHVVV